MKKNSFLSGIFSFSILSIALLTTFNAHASTIMKQFSSLKGVGGIVSDGSNLWVATSGGAVKYTLASGAKKVFANLSDLPDLNLVGAVRDGAGDIWFGSAEGYLTRLHPATETFTSFNALAATGWPITCMLFFKDYIFIGSVNGLSIFSIEKTSAQNVHLFGAFSSVNVTALRSYSDTLALMTDDGIAYCVVDNARTTLFSDPNKWTTVPTAGAVGIIHRNNGLVPYGRKVLEIGSTVWEYGGTTDLVKDGVVAAGFPSPVSCLQMLDNNSFVVGTESSFFWIYNPSTVAYTQIELDGPSDSKIDGCALDQTGMLWFVPQDPTTGIGFFNGTTWAKFSSSTDPALGYMASGVFGTKTSIIATTKNDIWMSTFAGGLIWLDRENGKWSSFEDPYEAQPHSNAANPNPPPWIESPLVRFGSDTASAWWTLISGVCEDSLGYIWVANSAAYNGAILHVRKPRDNVWRSFNINDSSVSFKSLYTGPIAAGRNMATGKQYVYLGYRNFNNLTGEGLTILSYGLQENPLTATINFAQTSSLQQIAVTDIAVANDTLVWIAATEGIYRITRNDPATLTKIDKITSSDPFFTVAAGYDGKAVFCKDRDIYTFSDGDTTLTRLTTSGKFGASVNKISLDTKNGVYWIASKKGLFRFDSGDSTSAIAGTGSIDVYPNPISRKQLSNGHLIRFAGLNNTDPRVRIFDAGGTLVNSLSEKNTKLTNWNGANQSGRIVIPGVYFYQARAGNGKHCRGKIFILP
jgi:streptogramin lyase